MKKKQTPNGARVFNPSFLSLRQGRVKNPCSVICAAILCASLCHAQNNIVYYGANSNALDVVFADTTLAFVKDGLENPCPVEFADTNLATQVQQRIAADLTIVFSPVVSFQDLEGSSVGEGICKTRSFRKAMLLTEEMQENVFLIDHNNQKSVRLSEVASSNYVHAFTLVDAHSNVFHKASEFVTALGNTDWTTQPPTTLANMYHLEPEEDVDFSGNFAQGFAAMWQEYKIFDPSVLCFFIKKRSEADGIEVPVIYLFSAEKAIPKNVAIFPIIFHDERWGIGSLYSNE